MASRPSTGSHRDRGSVLQEGWLVKSPPDRKFRFRYKFFKPHWHNRYFILEQLSAGDSVVLTYYENEKCAEKGEAKGAIDLNNCIEVLEQVESNFYRYIFAIRTIHKGRNRMYYLASESEEEMKRWVHNITSVLQLNLSDAFEPVQVRTANPLPSKRYCNTFQVSGTTMRVQPESLISCPERIDSTARSLYSSSSISTADPESPFLFDSGMSSPTSVFELPCDSAPLSPMNDSSTVTDPTVTESTDVQASASASPTCWNPHPPSLLPNDHPEVADNLLFDLECVKETDEEGSVLTDEHSDFMSDEIFVDHPKPVMRPILRISAYTRSFRRTTARPIDLPTLSRGTLMPSDPS